MTKKNTDDPKTRYVNSIKDIVAAAVRRDALLSGAMCVCNQDAPADEDIKELAKTNRAIAKGCRTMTAIEAEVENAFGVQALLGQDVPNPIRLSLGILAAQTATVEVAINDIAHLAALSAGRDTEGLLQIHEAFTRNGILRPHCSVSFRRASNIGELGVALKEQAFRAVCGLPADGGAEFDEIERVSEITGRR